MEYKLLSGPFTAGKLERDLDGHAAEGWRVAGTFGGHQLDEAGNPDGDRARARARA
jgi:hypothetical protein